jgi:hypothetical protein
LFFLGKEKPFARNAKVVCTPSHDEFGWCAQLQRYLQSSWVKMYPTIIVTRVALSACGGWYCIRVNQHCHHCHIKDARLTALGKESNISL